MEKVIFIAVLVLGVAIGLALPAPGGGAEAAGHSQFATLQIGA